MTEQLPAIIPPTTIATPADTYIVPALIEPATLTTAVPADSHMEHDTPNQEVECGN